MTIGRFQAVLSLGIAAAAGWAVGSSPILGMASGVGILLIVGIVLSARTRFLVVFLGGLLVFQSDQGVGAAKYGYLAAAILAVTVSLLRLARSREPVVMAFRPLLPAAAVLLLVLGSSAFVASSAGASMTSWFRDVLPYLMVALLPAVGLDAAQDLSTKQAERLLVFAGFLAAVGFAVDWLNRRGVSSLGLGRFVLATSTLAALGFAFTIASAGQRRNHMRWIVASGAIMTLMLVNGTRSNIVILAVAVGVAGSRAKLRVPPHRAFVLILQIGAAVTVALPLLASVLVDKPGFIQQRLGSAITVITGSAASDQSFMERQQATSLARQTFWQSPWFGTGPGHFYSILDSSGTSLDTPWLIPAKLGIIGVTALVLYLLAVVACVRRVRKLAGWSTLVTVGRGWTAYLLVLVPLVPWIEDKGFALALTLYLATLVASAREMLIVRRRLEQPSATVPSLDLSRLGC